MNTADDAFDRLRAINPVSETPVARPDPSEFLAGLEHDDPTISPTAASPSASGRARKGVLVGAAAAVIVAGLSFVLRENNGTSVVTDTPVEVTTTAAPTTTAGTDSATSDGAVADPTAIDAATSALVDRFESTYNTGDPDALLALLHPEMAREVVVDRDRRTYSQEYLREILGVEAALHTEISLDCRLPAESRTLTCTPTRYDDLHRILEIPGTQDSDWSLGFDEDGLLETWREHRENLPGVDNYEREAYTPFVEWARANHEDFVGELRPTAGGEWIVSEVEAITATVAAFAESRGVALAD